MNNPDAINFAIPVQSAVRYLPFTSDLYQEGCILVDVRSPSEYAKGHIPNAFNLPLFSDAERAEVGLLYKQKGKQLATIKGLEIVGKKLSELATNAIRLSQGKEIFAYCWRGGMRSASMAWLFATAGIETYVIQGGYKNYRNYVLNGFRNTAINIIVLGGKTGTGKTRILNSLEKNGEPVVDLERIAHHKGSAFGWIGEEQQPTNEQFENNLHKEWCNIESKWNYVWLENESRSVGSNFIPLDLWTQMKASTLIDVERSLDLRLQILVDSYAQTRIDDLIESFRKIEKRLGHEATAKAIQLIQNNDIKEAAAIALRYYDKCYAYNLEQNKSPKIVKCKFENETDEDIVNKLIKLRKENQYGRTHTH
ncbi:MAG: tRNA 2-selenouridine(34) synthase MnmH [Saprospiraceae bacterium]|nr:tRNA 2-selenouridine(34) synthase MnmH [Saprospiraceae bacterium]